MPVMPGYAFADTPHEKTVQPTGYRYGCKDTQRGGETIWVFVKVGWNGVKAHPPRSCG